MARIAASSQAGESAAQRETEVELRVSTLELFFDLVFVLTITQLASLLARDLSATGALQVFIYTFIPMLLGVTARATHSAS